MVTKGTYNMHYHHHHNNNKKYRKDILANGPQQVIPFLPNVNKYFYIKKSDDLLLTLHLLKNVCIFLENTLKTKSIVHYCVLRLPVRIANYNKKCVIKNLKLLMNKTVILIIHLS